MLRDLFSKPESQGEAPYWEDAKVAIQETGNWIKNADTKTTILAAALGVLFASVASQSTGIYTTLTTTEGAYLTLVILSLAAFLLAIIITVICIFQSLSPRTPPGSPTNRFSWPSMAARDLPPKAMPSASIRQEAWEQAHTLAKISAQKYKYFRWSLIFYLISFFAAGLLVAQSSPG